MRKTGNFTAVLIACKYSSLPKKNCGSVKHEIAASVGLDVLVEAHDESEVESALNAGAEIIGVNNRNLKDFSVDLQNSLRLRSIVPRDKIFVSESGIMCAADIKLLRAAGVNGFLIGEMLMRSNNITLDLQRLSGEIND